ncbi:bridge-like lipid transfer protein family member 1 [Macrobrachium rosenbergii]|uniref:bridge-like lipid transfer protein family member 1 n=1 Tax=Macrobrachium rosenbergii TaxID=79674 RepID=UPI0034D58E9D
METVTITEMIGSEGEEEEVFLEASLEGAPLFANTSYKNLLEDFNNPDLGYLVLSLLVAMVWAVYIILFNARVQGRILTALLRRFVKSGDLSIGSFSLSVLSGQIMFSNVIYVTEDYSLHS